MHHSPLSEINLAYHSLFFLSAEVAPFGGYQEDPLRKGMRQSELGI